MLPEPLRKAILFLNKQCAVMVVSAAALAIIIRPCEATIALPSAALVNAIIGKGLKRIIGEARPLGATDCSKTQGMPSSHANSLFFWATALSIRAMDGPFAIVVAITTYGYAALIALTRCTLTSQHTVAQVVVVGYIGTFSACVFELYLRQLWLPEAPIA